ncbi:hypothetical protein [Cellulomonas alba]|uniref:Uncharacterized protein n=1 Tax=Cellulomonas alba TaxID=3053467 RepID=A0ABT7SCY3_9CELL|nr:hypothetical protein [Cellulomonas alba]MDM7854030.1 hypothetical protein [Cellulomonas alba]
MSRWSGLRGKVAQALETRQPHDDSPVLLAAVHDGRTLDVVVRAAAPASLVLTCGDAVVDVPLDDAGADAVRGLLDTATLPCAGTWSVALRAGDGAAMPLAHRPEQRQDGPARAQDGPLSLLAARVARLAAGTGGRLVLHVEDVQPQPLVVDVVATPEGVVLGLGGPVGDGDEVVARSDDGGAVVLGVVAGGAARCPLSRLTADPHGPVAWRVVLRRGGTEHALRFHVGDLGRPGAAIKFPALDLAENAGVVRRRPVLAGGAFAIDVRVQGGGA